MIPKNLRYATTHEWASLDGDVCTVGITQFAVEQLTDVVYVELKPVGTKLKPGERFGEIESVKAVSDLYAPVEGELIAVNDAVVKDPGAVSADPYTKGWIVKIKVAAGTKLDALLSPEQYEQQIATQGH
ncbi:MAG: glycine cleavage system protein GcvH [Gemmataceae bacterium]|nr:glycine cleavage system protein GcvH [Gemmataceae bacterium]MCI0743522.1 glycine cleavage system protein GcvH [Gemmataceae bacterium]